MFQNIGRKIKMLARVLCGVGIVSSAVAGVVLLGVALDQEEPILAIIGGIVLGAGILFSWLGSFFLYGFGELIDCASELAGHSVPKQNGNTVPEGVRMTKFGVPSVKAAPPEPAPSAAETEAAAKRKTLEQWKKDGLIDEEEYRQKMKELEQ